jgi:membrane protein DedA with SNARE-associated domain
LIVTMFKKLLLYMAVFTGCFFEGETTLITSAFASHRGHLEIFIVMIIALIGSQLWDWIWFMIGRKRGVIMLARKPKLQAKAKRIEALLVKYPIPILLCYKFLYGFRTAVPLSIGMSSIKTRTFTVLSLINTVLWDILYSSLGYFFGVFLKANWKEIEHYEFETFIGIVISGIIIGLFLRYHSIKRVTRRTLLA